MSKNQNKEIPYSPERADAFFRQIERWNNADRYVDCIRELDKARSIADEEHAFRIACLFARACYNEVYFGSSFPRDQKKLLMNFTINALDDVWDEGIDVPEWNMYIAYAFEYTGELALAVRYAKHWLKLDPDNENAVDTVKIFTDEYNQAKSESDEDEDDDDDDEDDDDEDDVESGYTGVYFCVSGMVLLNDPYFLEDSYLRTLKRNWGFDCDWTLMKPDQGIYKMSLPGCSATFQLNSHKLPEEEANLPELAAKHNNLWSDADKTARGYNSYFTVAVVGEGAKPIECKETLIKLLSVFSWFDNVCGIYSNYVLYEPVWYRKEAEKFRGDGMSSLLLVWVFTETDEGKTSAYTCGMDDFRRDELEILYSSAPASEVRSFLARFAAGSLYGDPLEDGVYTLSGKKYTVTLSKSVLAYEDMSLKVSYP